MKPLVTAQAFRVFNVVVWEKSWFGTDYTTLESCCWLDIMRSLVCV